MPVNVESPFRDERVNQHGAVLPRCSELGVSPYGRDTDAGSGMLRAKAEELSEGGVDWTGLAQQRRQELVPQRLLDRLKGVRQVGADALDIRPFALQRTG